MISPDARDVPPADPRRGPRFVYLTDDPDAHALARFAWRLDAANNRPVGRGATVDAGLVACHAAARRVHLAVATLARTVAYTQARGSWHWRAGEADTGALGVRPYARRVECVRAFDQFLDAVAAAVPDAGVVRSFGPRTLRAFGEAVTSS